jgi:hypothetical protein
MSYKSTQRVTREQALQIIRTEIDYLGNDLLGDLLDLIADSGQSRIMSKFDNFAVSEFGERIGEYDGTCSYD